MGESTTVQRPSRPRGGGRIPSGPRPAPNASSKQGTSRTTSTSTISTILGGERNGSGHLHPSSKSISTSTNLSLDALIDAEHDFTTSPEDSPRASAASLPLVDQTTPRVYTQPGSRDTKWSRAATALTDDIAVRSNTSPFPILRPATPTSPISRSSTPDASSPVSVKPKPKPKPSRLNTVNLLSPTPISPTKPVSPSLKHWQQVRHHVLASPAGESISNAGVRQGKKLGLVSKAAGRFGFRHAAESVMGFDDEKRSSVQTTGTYSGSLTREEQEEIARERRMFARDVRNCVEACSLEESRRRYARLGEQGRSNNDTVAQPKGAVAGSLHGSSHLHAPRYDFNPQFSSFVPLLTELHRHLPAARAKKPWSRTCPHHAMILAELGVSFLPDAASNDGERQQALEIFGVIVKNWAPENEDEEIDRWVWLCRALRTQDRQVRNRGFSMLASLLHRDPSFPQRHSSSHTVQAFITLGVALIELLQALESTAYVEEHLQRLNTFLADLRDGQLISVDEVSLNTMIDVAEVNGATGMESELLWISAVTALRSNSSTVTWLLDPAATVLDRFTPPPIMHAVNPTVLGLRVRAGSLLLSSLAHILSSSAEDAISLIAWRVAEDSILRDLEMLPVDEPLRRALSDLLITLELRTSSQLPEDVSADAAKVLDQRDSTPPGCRQLLQILFSSGSDWVSAINAACKLAISARKMSQITSLIRSFLTDAKLAALGKDCVEDLWKRLAQESDNDDFAADFLRWLSRRSPQLLYKPLFALSAANQPSTLTSAYKLVDRLAQLLGPTRFWTHADPQMVVIVLMAASAPRAPKGKGKEGETNVLKVKLGRYAVLLELCAALSNTDASASTASRLKAFCESVEHRLGPLLEAEEQEGRLPDLYRALLCELFSEIRTKTLSKRSSVWQRMMLAWYPQGLCADNKAEIGIVAIIRAAAALHHEASLGVESQRPGTLATTVTERERLLALQLPISLSRLLVRIQAYCSTEDWQTLLPVIWRRLDDPSPVTPYSVFLLMKCSEVVPEQTRVILLSDLLSPDPVIRQQSLSKLSLLYSWRYQILSQRVISDGRRPIFHFANRTLEFVMTEIGTPQWVTPVDQQDAALQRFGSSLPMELRQRLMELGWSQDAAENNRSDEERMPLTRAASLMTTADPGNVGRSPSPLQPLARTSSSGSISSLRIRKRKAIFGPTLANFVNEQASIIAQESSGIVAQLSYEIIQTLQREDASMLVRTFSDGMGDFRQALARLNAMFTSLTPAFAYAALNAITGYLRNVLRAAPDFPLYSTALVTISRLAPHVSEISLRDIRKSKAEAILLPASIHEEEGGFQTHRPWHQSANDVQTAQLLILLQVLKVSPREVYLFKKMLSNLQIQVFAESVDLCRAWLLLITQLFTTVNRNYADRSELRHFLVNIGIILRRHQRDILVVVHAMRIFMLCSAKFRRMFASVGFAATMGPIYDTYSGGNPAIRDCIEYAMRSFYRIHQETLVYHTCISISDAEYDAAAVYSLLSCLSIPNSPTAGLATGIRGLNDQEELSALVQMLSGPEVGLSELTLGQAAKQADKAAAVSLEANLFPQANIIRLLVTVIAANPATNRAAKFLGLFRSIIPHVTDSSSKDLIRDAVEALGGVISKNKVDEGAILAFHSGEENVKPDWTQARAEYVKLVEVYASSGGQLSPSATKRVLDMVLDLLAKDAHTVAPAAAGIIRELAKTRLANSRPVGFLRDIAGLFRAFLAVVDFSGLLDSITSLIRRTNHGLDAETSEVIVSGYVEPSIRLLASAAEDNMAFIVPFRRSAVILLSAAVFLKGDAFEVVEQQRLSASLLASVIMPLSIMLERPQTADPDTIYDGIWVRLLRLVIPRARAKPATVADSRTTAVTRLLSMQVVKTILIRAPNAISNVRGLWAYIGSHVTHMIEDANGRFAEPSLIRPPPRAVDWLAWSLFELLALHPLPLMIHLRHSIQVSLGQMQDADTRSRASSPGEEPRPRIPSSPQMGGRARLHSRAPSAVHHLRMPSMSAPANPAGLTVAEEGRLTPDMAGSATGSNRSVSHARIPSQHLTPILGHARAPSASRPSFADLSARRVSRPAFDAFSPRPDRSPSTAAAGPPQTGVGLNLNYRFPSSAPAGIRPESGRGGAIVHLLSQPDMKPKLPGMGLQPRADPGAESLHMIIRTEEMIDEARRAVRRVMLVFGHPVEVDDDEEPLKTWNAHDALHVIAEQTRCLIEEEFRDVFALGVDTGLHARHAPRKSGASAMGSVFSDKHEEMSFVSPDEGYDVDRAAMEFEERQLPTPECITSSRLTVQY